jgi:hypothetical protein
MSSQTLYVSSKGVYRNHITVWYVDEFSPVKVTICVWHNVLSGAGQRIYTVQKAEAKSLFDRLTTIRMIELLEPPQWISN